jgi:hypothetical protein
MVLARLFPVELHAEEVLARCELRRDEFLLRLDAEEVVVVDELLVLDVERVTAEAGAVGEDDARAVRVRDLDFSKTATLSGTADAPG